MSRSGTAEASAGGQAGLTERAAGAFRAVVDQRESAASRPDTRLRVWAAFVTSRTRQLRANPCGAHEFVPEVRRVLRGQRKTACGQQASSGHVSGQG